MKKCSASCCAVLLLLSTTLPILDAMASDEHEHKSGSPHSAPKKEPSHPAEHQKQAQEQNARKSEERNERKAEEQNEHKAEQQQERKAEQQQERKAEQQQRKGEEQNERKAEQPNERRADQQNERNGEMQERRTEQLGRQENWNNPGRGAGEPRTAVGNPIQAPGRYHGFDPSHFGPRPQSPPPLRGMHRVPFNQAAPAPYAPPNLNPQQQQAFQHAQQSMQNNQFAVAANQAPPNYQNYQSAQTGSYMNNWGTTLGGQPITINAGNTYVNPIAQSSWPSWYQPTPGFGFTTGLVLGSVAAGLRWLTWGWPKYYGPHPAGFMYPTGYVPTPWIYRPWANQWRQPGEMAYAVGGPPPEYNMPITVEAVEPMQVIVPGPGGVPMQETINQLYMYNAYYYPNFGRWGYFNRQGYFIWVNPQIASLGPMVPGFSGVAPGMVPEE